MFVGRQFVAQALLIRPTSIQIGEPGENFTLQRCPAVPSKSVLILLGIFVLTIA
jgi:hypothetical protein